MKSYNTTSGFTPRQAEEVKLPNGLIVRFLNNSRKIAGDRWYICLTIEIPVPVKRDYFLEENEPEKSYNDFVNHFGKVYVFKYKKERNFIDEGEAESVFEQLKKDFLDTNISYLKSDRFAKMCIKKAFKDFKEQQRIAALQYEALKQTEAIPEDRIARF